MLNCFNGLANCWDTLTQYPNAEDRYPGSKSIINDGYRIFIW